MKIYESKFQSIDFEMSDNLFIVVWKHMMEVSDEIYRQELLNQALEFEKYNPSKVLIDTSVFYFSISPDTQTWNNENILTRVIAAGLKYVAILLAPDLFAQVSIEQNMSEETTGSLHISYCENIEDGLKILRKF